MKKIFSKTPKTVRSGFSLIEVMLHSDAGMEIMEKNRAYPVYYQEKITVLFEDEETEMEIYYRNQREFLPEFCNYIDHNLISKAKEHISSSEKQGGQLFLVISYLHSSIAGKEMGSWLAGWETMLCLGR